MITTTTTTSLPEPALMHIPEVEKPKHRPDLPPNDQLIREAEQQEMRFCSLMLKDIDCLKQAVEAGIDADHFWTTCCAEMFGVFSKYYKQHHGLCTYMSLRDICNACLSPEETTKKLQDYMEIHQILVKVDEFGLLKKQIIGRNAQRRAFAVVSRYYDRLLRETRNPLEVASECREAVMAIPTTSSVAVKSLDEFSLGDNNGGNLVGNRFICRGGGALLWGPSGVGKSVLVTQIGIRFALGGDLFGLRPVAPLRVLVIQAEDDDGDIVEFREGIYRGMGLSEADRALVKQNLKIACVDDRCGDSFLPVLESLVSSHKPDFVILNPLFAYAGGDPSKAELLSPWLRNGINPILHRHKCALLVVHHTPKPVRGRSGTKTPRLSTNDALYSYFGSADLIGWARAAMALVPTSTDGTYELRFVKRQKRVESNYIVDSAIQIRHDKRGICWLPVMGSDTVPAAAVNEPTADDLLAAMPDDKVVAKDHLIALGMERFKVGRAKARSWVDYLTGEGRIQETKLPTNATGGRPKVAYLKVVAKTELVAAKEDLLSW